MVVLETRDKPYLFQLQWPFFSSEVGLDMSYWGWIRVGMAQEVGTASGGRQHSLGRDPGDRGSVKGE